MRPVMVRAGHGLILIVFGLLSLGVIMVTSAGLAVGTDTPFSLSEILLGRTAIVAALAAVLMLIASRIPIRLLYQGRGLAAPAPWIVLGSIVLLVSVHIPGIGNEVNGARRWVSIGAIGFQPSELVKWGILFVIAWHATRRAARWDDSGPDSSSR